MLFSKKPMYSNYPQFLIADGQEFALPKAAHGQMLTIRNHRDNEIAVIGVGMPNSFVFQLHVHQADQWVNNLANRQLSDDELLECSHHLMYSAIACHEDARAYGSLSLYGTSKKSVLGGDLPVYSQKIVMPNEWYSCLDSAKGHYESLWGGRFYGKDFALVLFTSPDCDWVAPLHLLICGGVPMQLSPQNMEQVCQWGKSVAKNRQN